MTPDTPYVALAPLYDKLSTHDIKVWRHFLMSQLERHNIRPPAKILDAACGTGTLTLGLYRAGYRIHGVDISQDMLTVASARAAEFGASIPMILGDIRRLNYENDFEALTCNCDGINYLIERADAAAFFKGARRALKEKGVLIFDISSPCRLRAMDGQVYCEEWDDGMYIWQNACNDTDHTIEMQLSFFRHTGDECYTRIDELHIQKIWEVPQIMTMLDECGFSCQVCADFTNSPPNDSAARIHFIAVKTK